MKTWTIGKNPKCNIVVNVPTVSGRHCRLTENDQGYLLEDLGSTNGTFVGGKRIAGTIKIKRDTPVLLGLGTELPWENVPRPKASGSATQVELEIKLTIGSGKDNDIIYDLPMVSSKHAKIKISGKTAELEDLESSNGTFVNSRHNRISKITISPDDVVFFGSYRVPASKLINAGNTVDEKESATMCVQNKPIVLGRDASCDEVIPHPLVSRRHASFGVLNDKLYVEDLNSGNGTFVNGKKVLGTINVSPGDIIQIASFSYCVQSNGVLTRANTQDNLSIEAESVSITLGGTPLLENISLTICPGEFVGLMGPSGAGKTLLLSALNGYLPPTSGRILINGQDLYANYDIFRGQIGYVPQDDIVHSTLTVSEALYYTARLRMPSDTTDDEIKARIEGVLAQLELTGQKNVLIGSAEQRGISGGQRKRVNLAMELITEPSLLILDEPTSGLSSEDTLNVMKLLRGLADKGMTILMTIHQPSLEAYQQMDNLILVAKDANAKRPGRLAFYGPAYPDAIQFFRTPDKHSQPDIPDLILSGLAAKPADEWISKYKQSPYFEEFIENRSGNHEGGQITEDKIAEGPAELIQQASTLTRRGIAIKLRDKVNTAILLLQAPVVASLIVMVYSKASDSLSEENCQKVSADIAHAIFFLCIAALWFGCSNSAREIVSELAIYKRERMVNLKIICYLISKFSVLGVFCAFQCICLFMIVDYGCDLGTPILWLLPMLFLISMVGVGVGLTISAFSKTSEVALGMLPLVIIPMVLLGGGVKPVHENEAIEPIAIIVPSRWAFEAVLLVEASYQENLKVMDPETGDEENFDVAEYHFPIKDDKDDRMGVFASLLAVVLSMILVGCAPAIVLKHRDIH